MELEFLGVHIMSDKAFEARKKRIANSVKGDMYYQSRRELLKEER